MDAYIMHIFTPDLKDEDINLESFMKLCEKARRSFQKRFKKLPDEFLVSSALYKKIETPIAVGGIPVKVAPWLSNPRCMMVGPSPN